MIAKLQSLRVQILGVAIVLALVLAAVAFAPAPAAALTHAIHHGLAVSAAQFS